MLVEIKDLSEVIGGDWEFLEYYSPGSQHRVIHFWPDTGDVEVVSPTGGDKPGDGYTFYAGEYIIIE